MNQDRDMGIKAVIFDMDGLMLDTEKLYELFWERALQFYGYQPNKQLLLDLRSLSRDLAAKLLQQNFGLELDYHQIRNKRVELMNAYIEEHGIEKKEGLDELLVYLKEKEYRMAVATATEYERTKLYLTQLGLHEYFDAIVCGPMVAHGKPAPDIYHKAIELLGKSPKECLALEDSPNGVTSAYRAGCNVIMIPECEENEIGEGVKYQQVKSLRDIIGIL